jgi:hypothetical protein
MNVSDRVMTRFGAGTVAKVAPTGRFVVVDLDSGQREAFATHVVQPLEKSESNEFNKTT